MSNFSYNPLPRLFWFFQMDLGNEKHRCGESLDWIKDDNCGCLSTCQSRWLQICFELAHGRALPMSEQGQAQFCRSSLFSFKYQTTPRSKFVQSQNSCVSWKTDCCKSRTVLPVVWSVICCLSFRKFCVSVFQQFCSEWWFSEFSSHFACEPLYLQVFAIFKLECTKSVVIELCQMSWVTILDLCESGLKNNRFSWNIC